MRSDRLPSVTFRRVFQNSKLFIDEARTKLKDYKAIMTQTRKQYDELKKTGIKCSAFLDEAGKPETIEVSNLCWKHVFEHKKKRRSEAERLGRALVFQSALKLLEKATTYQERSHEKDQGQRPYMSFGIVGYVRGNRIKVIVRRDYKHTNSKKVLYSFYQVSPAPKEVVKVIEE